MWVVAVAFFAGAFVLRAAGSELYGALSSCAGHASSDPGSHLRRTAPAPSEPDCIDEPKKRWRVFLHGSSILGRLPGFFLSCHSFRKKGIICYKAEGG